MLENMNDEDRFKTTYNICNDVLKGVAEGSVRLEGRSAFCLLRDALACLASEEIKLASLKNKADEDEGITEEDMRGALVAAAKKTIISQVGLDGCDLDFSDSDELSQLSYSSHLN